MTALFRKLLSNGSIRFGGGVLLLLILVAGIAPWLGTVDPAAMDSGNINTLSGTVGQFSLLNGSSVAHTFWMGADNFGRDIYSRVLYGTRVSLLVGLFTALVALLVGGALGMLAGYFRALDMVLMRFMDGLMAIPAILLAIALVAALGAQLWTVVVAIAIPEIPRVTRLVRSLVLTLREEPFVEAAKALATPTPVILLRHILPNAMGVIIVNTTLLMSAAILLETALSYLGFGITAPNVSLGQLMALAGDLDHGLEFRLARNGVVDAGRELGHRAERRRLGGLAAGVGVDLGVQHEHLHIGARVPAARKRGLKDALRQAARGGAICTTCERNRNTRTQHNARARCTSQIFQLFGNHFCRTIFLKAQFWMSVDISPNSLDGCG